MSDLSPDQVETLEAAVNEWSRPKTSEEFGGDLVRDFLAPTVAALVAEAAAEAWPCANYTTPVTCLSAATTRTGRCDFCTSQARDAVTEARAETEALRARVEAEAAQWEREADNQAQWRGRGYAERLRAALTPADTPSDGAA